MMYNDNRGNKDNYKQHFLAEDAPQIFSNPSNESLTFWLLSWIEYDHKISLICQFFSLIVYFSIPEYDVAMA